MAWMPKTQAALAMGVSVRTLERRISAGRLPTRKVSRQVMVDVEGDPESDPMGEIKHLLAEEIAADLSHRAEDDHVLRDALSAMGEYRNTLQAQVRRIRRAASLGWGAAALFALIAGITWGQFQSTRADLMATRGDDGLSDNPSDTRPGPSGAGGTPRVGEGLKQQRNRLWEDANDRATTLDALARAQRELVALRAELVELKGEVGPALANRPAGRMAASPHAKRVDPPEKTAAPSAK